MLIQISPQFSYVTSSRYPNISRANVNIPSANTGFIGRIVPDVALSQIQIQATMYSSMVLRAQIGRTSAVAPLFVGPLEMVEKDIPEPRGTQVRIKIQACGICHGDSVTKDGLFPGIQYPRVPGHEIAGIIDSVGEGVTEWKVGQRVAVGWHGGHCGHCESCRRGDFITCGYAQVPGISYEGGYADYMVTPTEAIASIPDELSFTEAATTHVCRNYHIQRASEQWCMCRRCRCNTRDRWTWPSGNTICFQDGF